jgi:hypothetical protein
MNMRTLLPLTLLGACTIVVEHPGKPDGTDDSGEPPLPDTGSLEQHGVDGTVTGTLTLQLYTTDDEGDVELLDWVDTYGSYPFGQVFVTAYNSDDEGKEDYYGQDVVTPDAADGSCDDYAITLDEEDVDDFRIYASVDWYPVGGDGILGTYEPSGIYADTVEVFDGDTVTGVDITIYMPYYDIWASGGGCDVIYITGTAELGSTWEAGDVVQMLYDSSNAGPYWPTRYTDITSYRGGGETPYTGYACQNYGSMRLLGAWDSNVNGLIDPSDLWGSYVSSADVDGNPIAIGTTDLAGYDIQIPFGEAPDVVPFVALSGTVTLADGFESLTPGATVYVAALKSRHNEEFSTSEFGSAYDSVVWTGSELTGYALDFAMVAPANTVTYLLAYVDEDGDGLVNEVGELVGSWDDSLVGRLSTGSSSQSDLEVELTHPE